MRRVLPIEHYFLDYGKQDRGLSEFVEKISIPRPHPETVFKAYKISKRFDQDISAVLGAFCLTFDHDRIVAARIAYGGMAGTPKRSPSAEAALTGKRLDRAAIETAMDALAADFTPLTDMRASADYRMAVARNLLLRLLAEADDSGVETRLWDKREISHDHA
ncbi:hypothetical protein [Oleomonas cavernae]|uniref:hypothetical protein n=1 Tax=Oleomonas cavernae TaxID=2320859 RepID=UPI001F44A0C0|nr:hypothetical protein [Oleomonas cavernae]